MIRAAKFASIIILSAAFFGGMFAFSDYIEQFTGKTARARQRSEEAVQNDTTSAVRWRLLVGSGVGAVIGVVYTVRCLWKNEDP